jgi:hypothetical protein
MKYVILVVAVLAWAGVTVMAFFLWKIARFYEHSSQESAHSWLFVIPTILLPAGAVCYLILDTRFVGFPAGDLLLFAGGISLLLASAWLQQVMMGEK